MDNQMETPAQEPQKPSNKYAKKPLWQWALIYLVIAIIVYVAVYFLFIRDSGSGGGINY